MIVNLIIYYLTIAITLVSIRIYSAITIKHYFGTILGLISMCSFLVLTSYFIFVIIIKVLIFFDCLNSSYFQMYIMTSKFKVRMSFV
jgi:hypothetical protein